MAMPPTGSRSRKTSSEPRPPASGRCQRAAWWLLALLAVAGPAAGCAPSGQGAPDGPGALYALNALDGTLTPLDAERAVAAGPPLPAGDAPAQAAAGPGGSLLVLSFSRERPATLTHVVRGRSGWQARPVPAGTSLREATLASDGERYAAVAHHAPSRPSTEAGRPEPPPANRSGRCRLTLLDLTAGETRAHTVCAPEEQVAGLALGSGPGGPVAYLGVWDTSNPRDASEDTGPPRAPAAPGAVVPTRLRDRVVAVDARSGRVLAVRGLASPPEHLQLAPPASAAARAEGRLYVLEGAPGPESDYSTQGRWRLLGLHPVTLETEQEAVLRVQVRALAVAPDGAHAYALAGGGKDVMHVDLSSGVTRPLGALPGHASGGLAVTARHVFVPNPLGSEVWALDRRDGRLAATIAVGLRPVAVVAAGPWA